MSKLTKTGYLPSYAYLLIGGLIYFITAKLGMSVFSLEPTGLSLLWLPFGIGVILVERFGFKALPVIFVASFLSHFNLATDTHLIAILHRIIPSIADTLAPLLSVYLIQKYIKTQFDNIQILLPFTLIVGVLPSFLVGIVISLNWAIAGYIDDDKIINYITMIVFSDTLGLLLLYPLYKSLEKLTSTKHEIITFAYTLLFGLSILLISIEFSFLIFLLYPLLLIAVFKLNITQIMSLLLILVVVTLSISSQFEVVYLIDETPMSSILMLSSFLATLTFMIIGMALVLISQDAMSSHICQIEKDHVKIALEKNHAQALADKERADKEQKAQFLSMLSHELKTPLSVIRMGIAQPDMSDNLRNHIIQATNDMGMVINRCAVLEKVDEAIPLNIEKVNLIALINYVKDQCLSPESFHIDFSQNLTDVSVQTDEDWLKVILSNLLDNALKYSPKDSTIHLNLTRKETHWCISVSNETTDTPPDPEEIFNKYYRSPSARMQTGSGLGLYIVKRLALQLNARIEYIPTANKVTFQLCLTI